MNIGGYLNQDVQQNHKSKRLYAVVLGNGLNVSIHPSLSIIHDLSWYPDSSATTTVQQFREEILSVKLERARRRPSPCRIDDQPNHEWRESVHAKLDSMLFDSTDYCTVTLFDGMMGLLRTYPHILMRSADRRTVH